MLQEKQSRGTYLSIIGGEFRKTVQEGTEGAKKREYELKDGSKKTKWEKSYESLTGTITGINFHDGEYGKNITIFFKDGEEEYGVSMGVATAFAEDIMKKLPAVNLNSTLTLTPYDFEDDKGKRRRGVTIYQDGKKLENFFYDKEAKKQINGAPSPENTDEMDSEDWKMYYAQHRKFTIKYIQDKLVPKFGEKKGFGEEVDNAETAYNSLPGDDVDEEIPF
jgi:hypothetical protein